MKRIESVIGGLNLDLFAIADKFCKNDTCIVLRSQSEIEHIFSELYCVEPRMIAYYLKVKVLELLMFLNHASLQDYQEKRRYFARNQVQTVKKIQACMTANLRNHYTLQELSEKFEIPLTSMKVCFKGVYMKRDMRKYILRKLVELIFTLLFVTLLSFLLMRLSSVDPATAYAKRMIGNPTEEQIEKTRVQLGFDKPLLIQYGRWVWDFLHFDLGTSLANGHDVWTDIATAFPKTLGIVGLASIFQIIFIVIVSCIAFLLPWKIPKKAIRLFCIFGVSIPSFYLATVYLDYFAVQKSLISVAGNTTLLSYISPAICIGIFGASFYTPLLMDALEHESHEDYAFYARCCGLSEKRLLLCHFLPIAAIGLVPNFLQSIGLALANATVIESIFSIPGFGYLIVNHVLDRDTPMIHAEVFFLALAIALCNIAADLVQWAIGRKKGVV